MRLKAPALGFAASIVTAVGFGICGLFFTFAPGPASAFVSWVLHVDVTTMARPVSVPNLLGGIVLFSINVGLFVGLTAALYNRFTLSRAA